MKLPLALIASGLIGGLLLLNGGKVAPGPSPVSDVLQQSYAADRASQVRILRQYASKTFASEPEAQAWLNEQRIEARKTDFIPYTDELGKAADDGVEAVKALADNLEGK